MMEEGLRRTPNKKIQIGKPLEIDEEQFWKALGAAARSLPA